MTHKRDRGPNGGRYEPMYPGLSIRRRLEESLRALSPGKRVWLIVGDFNHLKDINNLYGKTAVDVMLAAAHQAILTVLEDFEIESGIKGIRHAFVGDEVTMAFPPSTLTAEEAQRFLHNLKRGIATWTEERYFIGALINLHHHLRRMPPVQLYECIERMKGDSIFLDLSRRRRGHLVIASMRRFEETVMGALRRALRKINGIFDMPSEERLSGTLKWLYNKEKRRFEACNGGFALALEASCASVSSDVVLSGNELSGSGSLPEGSVNSAMSRMFLVSQERLQKEKSGVALPSILEIRRKKGVSKPVMIKEYESRTKRLPLLTEGALSYVIFHLGRSGEEGVLLQMEPFYNTSSILASTAERYHAPLLLRGNERGMGLKGINGLCGYETGDRIVCLLEDLVFAGLRELSRSHGIPLDTIHVSRFIDCFRIYIHNASLKPDVIAISMKNIAQRFNALTEGISLSHLKGSIVFNRERIDGGTLLRRLEMTAIAEKKPFVFYDDGLLQVRHFTAGVEEEGEALAEETAFHSALSLGVL